MALPSDGVEVAWATWDGKHREDPAVRWDNEAWTATGRLQRERAEYVCRLSPLWVPRQFLLFRDLDEPDLWLGTDGRGRWGEVNGAHRPDLDGGFDIGLACTPFTHAPPIRRLPLAIGDAAEMPIVIVDVETLGAVVEPRVYERHAARRWRVTGPGVDVEFDVDEHGVPLDVPGEHRRV